MELGVGLVSALFFIGVRAALNPIAGDRAPYSFVFLAVVSAAVLAGWRSGLVSLVIGQGLAWSLIVADPAPARSAENILAGGLIAATVAQLLVLGVITLYQREVGKAMDRQAREMDLLSEALREIDHRTKNNYQTVVALLLLQAQRAELPDVRRALTEAADRIRAVSLASDRLALRSEDLGTVRLSEHLEQLCQQIKRGLVGEEVRLDCDFAEITTQADTAIHLSIIVNELVTNALKHAFDETHDSKEIRIRCRPSGSGIELTIADNGRGMAKGAARSAGLGNRLVQRFVSELNARHEVASSDRGTTHRIVLDPAA